MGALMPALGSALVNFEQLLRRQCELGLARSLTKKILYIDSSRYDETPMQATTEDITHAITATPLPFVPDASTGVLQRRGAHVQRIVLGRDKGVAKLFQTESLYAALGSLTEPGKETPTYIGLVGTPVTFAQTL